MEPSSIVWVILWPLFGAVALGTCAIFRVQILEKWAGWIATAALGFSFFLVLPTALEFLSNGASPPIVAHLGSWMNLPGYDLRATLKLDALSAVLCLVITGVGFLIHVYSIGYMAHEAGKIRYFAYLNLFCAFMLLLVTASSFPLMFVGWEGVGLCSYLLIGFWFTDREKAAAGKKAFIVNRIGDAGLLFAMFLAFSVFHSFEISSVAEGASKLAAGDHWILELMAIFFFIGCVGKSAQFPLYLWLPDAMAGPTPVSALIHAATMVTSGVYLLARLAPLYALAPLASGIVMIVGTFTALFAATIALVQDDIKKILAFSTVSQLGFMVLAMGVGAPNAGVLHLVTHAFFKALLFLAAGSVIHAMSGEQNIFKMGGLKTYIVATTLTFTVGFLAIIGFPFMSGWVSKDAILYATLENGHDMVFLLATIAAILTTVYMTRLFCLVFLGVQRIPKLKLHEIHESPSSMIWPMWVLAFFSIFAGLFPFKSSLQEFFHVEHKEAGGEWLTEMQMTILVTLFVLGALVATFRTYANFSKTSLEKFVPKPLKTLLYHQYRFDEVAVKLANTLMSVFSSACRLFDEWVIDRTCNGFANKARGAAFAFSSIQNGKVQAYVVGVVGGCVLMGWYLISRAS